MIPTRTAITDPVLTNDWHVLARSSDLAEGEVKPARLLGEDVVLWRGEGKACVWQDLCIHRGARLSLGRTKNCRLVCPYHGWNYDTEGQCTGFPAHPGQKPPPRASARVYDVREKYGFIWASPGRPEHDVPPFPEWEDATFRKIFCGPFTYRAAAPRAVENFLDVAHFPFVHANSLGDENHTEIGDYEAYIDPKEGLIANNITVWQPDPDGTGVGAPVSYDYRVPRPLTGYFVKRSGGPKFTMYMTITPVEELLSVSWVYIAMNYAPELSDEEIRDFQTAITLQDLPVVESQHPERLPLDLQAELHLRSDRAAICYRQWLGKLGLSFGTA